MIHLGARKTGQSADDFVTGRKRTFSSRSRLVAGFSEEVGSGGQLSC